MKTILTGCIVTKGGMPCQLYHAAATAHTQRGGVLIPITPGSSVYHFTQTRDANRAIKRTQRVVDKLKTSLLSDWVRLSPLQDGLPFDVLPLEHVEETKAVDETTAVEGTTA